MTTTAPDRTAEQLVVATDGVARSSRTRVVSRHGRWSRPYTAINVLLDFLAASVAGIVATEAWPRVEYGFGTAEVLLAVAALGLPAAWVALLWGHGGYEARYLGIGSAEFKRVVTSSITLTAVICFVAFTLKLELSRYAVATVLPLILVLTLASRFALRKGLHAVRARGHATQRLLLVGTLGEALSVYRITHRNPYAGLYPVGICLSEGRAEHTTSPVPVFEGIKDVLDRAAELRADAIAVCGHRGMNSDNLRRLAWQLEGTGVDLVVAPSLTNIAGPRVHIRPVEGLPLLHVEEPTLAGAAWLAKGLLDRTAAVLGLLAISPLLAVVALLVRRSSPGPVFFRQERIGRAGRTFRVWKFRTMYVDAELRLAELLDQNESDGLLFKMKDDPRITSVGKWLRKYSIDELPQLFNVVVGDMSLVGPRPPLAREVQRYEADMRRRLLVPPGITGLWQVSGRSNLSWEDSVRLDLYYVDNWSLMFDAMILWKTLFVVLKHDGAY